MKVICYVVNNTGVDGKEKATPIFASYDEVKRDKWYEFNPNKDYYSCEEIIIDVEKTEIQALAKLNAIEKLVLKFPQKEYIPKKTIRG